MFQIGDSVGLHGAASQENDGQLHLEELTVFGDFDPDDPDFAQPSSRPRSRNQLTGGSRNSSTSSLRRIASNNSIGRQLSGHLRQLSLERLRPSSSSAQLNGGGHVHSMSAGDLILSEVEDLEDGSKQHVGGENFMMAAACKSCGVLWYEEQVTFDCIECGGFALDRPCIKCEGDCGQTWTRDVATSQLCGLATWHGNCSHLTSASDSDHDAVSHGDLDDDSSEPQRRRSRRGAGDNAGDAAVMKNMTTVADLLSNL